MITRDFDLWITQGHTKRLVFNANQYDQGETWRFRILGADGNPIVPTTAAIIGQKKDGHAILVQGTVSDGKVVITETEQMTACAGLTEFELLLNGETHGTANFTVQVEKRPGDDADLSDSDLSLIQDAVDAAAVIVDVIGDGDPSEVIGEHVDAWLDAHPEATTTVEDGAITAPKINQSLWDKLLVNEEASGAVASFDDGADDVPVSSLKVALEPIQTGSGDPSPSNVRPIIASNGKNLLPKGSSSTSQNVTFTVNDDGTVTANGTASSTAFWGVQFTIPAGTYTYNGCPSGGGQSTYYCDIRTGIGGSGITGTGSDTGNGNTFTITDPLTAWLNIRIASGTVCNNLVFKPMIRLASITDSSYQPYQGIMVERTGKNLLPDSEYTTNATGATSHTVNATGKIPKGTIITISGDAEGTALDYSTCQIQWRIGSTVVASKSPNTTTTFADDVIYNNLMYYTTGTLAGKNVKLQAELGSTATAYEPYTGTTYPYTLGQNVYGGSVDLATGVLTVTHRLVTFDGTETWNSLSTGYYTLQKGSDLDATEQYSSTMVCNYLPYIYSQPSTTASFNAITHSIRVSLPSVTSLANFRAYLASNPLTIVLKLATPTTVQLTPQEVKTLLGYNNISSTGTVDVIYHADTKLYVDKMTAVDNNIIAPTEADFVATRNYTVNDLVIVNDTLYKCTANIASGSAITPNSNVTQTTLGALIKALS